MLYLSSPPAALARLLWGQHKPANWKRDLPRIIARTIAVAAGCSWKLQSGTLPTGEITMRVGPEFLGGLQPLLRNGKLVLRNWQPNPEQVLSRKAVAFLQAHGWIDESPRSLRSMVQHMRVEAQKQPSLQSLAGQRAWQTIIIPAALGEPITCHTHGPLAQLLVDHRTRWKDGVTKGQIAAASGTVKVVCPLLDAQLKYIAFAGNNGGRGYRLDTWAKFYGTTPARFTAVLKTASGPLGLVVVGLGKDGVCHDLEALMAGGEGLQDRVNVRFYTRNDFRPRWAEVFGWTSPKPPATSQILASATDHPVVAARVKAAGVRKLALACGVDASHLSHWLKTGSGLSVPAAMRVRRQVQESAGAACGPAALDFFVGAKTLGQWAVAYCKLGWCVIPLIPGTRKGYISWKPFETALPTEEQVRRWWQRWPNASIGMILGPISGLMVIDTDSLEAHDLLVDICGEALEHTPRVISGSHAPGKFHYYFQHPNRPSSASNKKLLRELEIRGTNGLIVAPPSIHWKTENTYDWVEGQAIWQLPLAPVPQTLEDALAAATPVAESSASVTKVLTCSMDAGFTENFSHWNGQRLPAATQAFLQGTYTHAPGWNQRLFEASRWCRDHGVPDAIGLYWLTRGAGPINAGEEAKATATVKSAYSYTPLKLAR